MQRVALLLNRTGSVLLLMRCVQLLCCVTSPSGVLLVYLSIIAGIQCHLMELKCVVVCDGCRASASQLKTVRVLKVGAAYVTVLSACTLS